MLESDVWRETVLNENWAKTAAERKIEVGTARKSLISQLQFVSAFGIIYCDIDQVN